MTGVPNIFANATVAIPLSQLDANFATTVTIGSTQVGLGNTVASLAGLTNVSATTFFASGGTVSNSMKASKPSDTSLFAWNADTSGTQQQALTCVLDKAGSTANYLIYSFTNNAVTPATPFYVRGDGNVYNTNNVYGAISMRALKTNIERSGSQWADVKALSGLVSKFNLAKEPDAPRQIGMIAEDVLEVSPGLVDEMDEYTLKANEDGASESVPTGNKVLHLKYNIAMLKLLKAFGEAQERIEALEAQLNGDKT